MAARVGPTAPSSMMSTPAPAGHRGLGASREVADRGFERAGATVDREGGVEHNGGEGIEIATQERGDGRGEEEERVEREEPGRIGLLGQQRSAGPEQHAQAHDQAFAQRVDRRVGDLREALLHVVMDRTGATGQGRERRVVTHRERRFVALGGHGLEHHGELFFGVTVRGLPNDEIVRWLFEGLTG